MRSYVIGSRGSKLALLQARQVLDAILRLNPGLECRIEVIRTGGDAESRAPLSSIGGVGVFVKEIEEALLRGDIDVAVHSAKDMPAESDPRLCIAAFPEREDPRDALVSRGYGLACLPSGARVGTGSARRQAQLLAVRPDLRMADIRGNVDTRLRKLDDGDYDAIVLACAGLRRMGLESRISEPLAVEVCLPAAGQGALAVQCRTGDEIAGFIAQIDHAGTRRCVEAERAVLRRLGAGCRTPIGVLARLVDGEVEVEAMVAGCDGSTVVRDRARGSAAAEQVADRLLASELGASLKACDQ
jgi:hydroxymethylbilane synthase